MSGSEDSPFQRIRLQQLLAGIDTKKQPVGYDIMLANRRTFVTLEKEIWQAVDNIASQNGRSRSGLVTQIDRAKPVHTTLASAIRIFVLQYYRNALDCAEREERGEDRGIFRSARRSPNADSTDWEGVASPDTHLIH
ncbi:ribbon-helix-helix domain-containing protein [Azospirillum sp. SYSU D00513]|uniref:ribbon-helix-helix domain-containing protein n=1 Tax=Azospirillum sp. SYSU D00513 TaxID=2812561 RepID=UPI001A96313C|nr:ribbon-helix-helix domain-containing protein [Azospirillum sp. SYSU D00513]